MARSYGIKLQHRYDTVLDGFAADLTADQIAALRAEPAVAFIEEDAVVAEAAGLSEPVKAGETVPPGIRRVGGVAGTLTRPAAAPVAVLDTGLDLANADLAARAGTNCVKPGAAPQDDSGHGTNVGGIIGARNTGAGVTGVAPARPSTRSRCWPRTARARSPRSSAASTGSRPTPARSASASRT